MKKLITLIASCAMILSVATVYAQSVDAGLGLGINHPYDPGRVGFDSSLSLDYNVNQFFAIGVETGFGWVKEELNAGERTIGANVSLTESQDINFLSFPLMGVLTVRIPLGEYESPFVPFISGGAGYSWTIYDRPGKNYTFSGFTWQAVAGFTYDFGAEAGNMLAFLEAGYRGTDIKDKIDGTSYELDMSSAIVRAGVIFRIGEQDY